MIITGTSVAGAQEHPQFTADQTEIRLAKEELQTVQLSIEEYLKECWKNKQEVIDVSAYKLNEEELNKVIFGIHYENPEYYWVLRNTAINKDEETGFVKTYYQYYEGTTGKPLDRSEELEPGMVFALEPKIVLPGIGPVGIENSWVVTNERIEKLTNCNEEIIELK